jgi:exopolysaccharide biosynthesis predicted pyruvyltransferase EpsI
MTQETPPGQHPGIQARSTALIGSREFRDDYLDFLAARAGKTVYLKPYHGNSGDGLIWKGNELLIQRFGLVRVLDPGKASVILWPGGNPTMWNWNVDEWEDCWKRWPDAEFVVGPATFHGNLHRWRERLSSSKGNITALFARDRASYATLAGLGLPLSTHLAMAHDPALHLRDSAWIREIRAGASEDYILAAFRNDHEAARRLPEQKGLFRRWPFSAIHERRLAKMVRCFDLERIDLVKGLSPSPLPLMYEDVALRSFESFVEKVSRAAILHTDRLHTMILGVLLGKRVAAHPTSYAKLEEVYHHSMADWADVKFHP